MSSNIKLLPCPFCGGEAISDSCGNHWVRCTFCGARGCVESTRKEAIEQWNTRKPMENLDKQISSLYEDCENGAEDDVVLGWNRAIDKVREVIKEGEVK